MYIVEIIPLQKGIPLDSLSYFSVHPVQLGSVVEIPLQSRTIQGIVISQKMARDVKSNIRTSNFSLKSIGNIVNDQQFPKEILQTLQIISQQTLIPIGTLISTLFPEIIFKKIMKWKPLSQKQDHTLRIITLPFLKRITAYQTLIHEIFIKKKSLLIITPTVLEQNQLHEKLKTSIPPEMRTIILNGSLASQKKESTYQLFLNDQQPTIFFTTPQYAIIPDDNLETCIFESINSPYYQNDFSSFIDFRNILLPLLQTLGLSFYLADSFLSPQQILLIEKRKAFIDRTTSEKIVKEKIILIEKEQKNSPLYQSPFFSSQIINAVPQHLKKGQKVFIYSARKSIATITSCSDCGYTVHCPNCQSIMTLIKTNPLATNDRIFHCNLCKTEIPPMNRCPDCLGWNIRPLGITTESIIEELERLFPNTPLYQGSQNFTKTDTACRKLVKEWNTTGGILVGTQKIIPFISEVDITIIASFEHVISIPHFQTSLQALWIMENLLEKTREHYIIQTKHVGQDFLQDFQQQNLEHLIRVEDKLYSLYDFPPYATLISITMENISRKDHHQAKDFLKQSIQSFEHTITSNFFEYSQTYTLQAMLHINSKEWSLQETLESKKLRRFLEILRGHAQIKIETPWITIA